jgi:hypothetical protein
MSGETDWMSLGEWVVALRDLHERARLGKLPPEELKRYLDERETLAKAILAAQRLQAAPNARGRQSLRVARKLKVDLTIEGVKMRAETLDVGIGGFAVLMPSTARVGQRVDVSLELKPGIFIEGKAKVVNLQKKGKPYRIAFRFEDLSAENTERLGIAVFDAALAGIMPGGK